MNQLPASTVRLLTSTQVITGSSSIVKELVENALDAKATSLEIKIENYGLDKLEVKDNGVGISVSDIPYAAKKHYTSKISTHDDLLSLQTLGFRGEALGAIAAISEMEIVTKCAGEIVGRSYKLDCKGDIVKECSVPVVTGTSITISHMYKAIPVRKQYYSSMKRKKEELKLITDLLMSYGVIHHRCRFVLKHNKSVIWQKNSSDSIYSSLCSVLSPSVVLQLQHFCIDVAVGTVCDMYLSQSDADFMLRSTNDRMFLYVNQRFIRDKELEKLMRTYLCKQKPLKYPICFLHLKLPPCEVDVNLEPNKTKVLITNKSELLQKLEKHLASIYNTEVSNNPSAEPTPERQRTSADGTIDAPAPPQHIATGGMSDYESDQDVFLSSLARSQDDNINKINADAAVFEDSLLPTKGSAVTSSTMIEGHTLRHTDLFSLSSFDSDDDIPLLDIDTLTAAADEGNKSQSERYAESTPALAAIPQTVSATSESNKQVCEVENTPPAVEPVALSSTVVVNKSSDDIEIVERSAIATSSDSANVKQKTLTSYNTASNHDNGTTATVVANEWVRGQLIKSAAPPVGLAPCRQLRDSSNLARKNPPPDGSFGSMIREETIPDNYRKFVSSSAAKKRKLNTSNDRPQPSIKSMFNKCKTTPLAKRTNTLSMELKFSLKSLQDDYNSRLGVVEQTSGSNLNRTLIHCGSPRTTTGAVVLSNSDTLMAFNPFVFKEQEVYSRLLKEYEVPSEPVSVQLMESMISPQAWLSLTSLPVDECRDQAVMSDSLHLNGFSLQRQSSEQYRVAAAASVIPGYGTVPDVEDILLHLSADCCYRPTKVLHHIQSEVIRQVRDIDRFDLTDVLEMLNKVDQEKDITEIICPIHSRRMFTPLSRLSTC